MPSINTTASGHAGPAANSGWQWLPYDNEHFLKTLQEAIDIIDKRVKGYAPCDRAFQRLPSGRTFTSVWSDPSIWISYDPNNGGHKYGATLGQDVTITRYSLRMGRWTVAATLVHELAHTNGADGVSHDAEGTLRSCLLQGLEDPNIVGAVQRVGQGTAIV